MQQMNWQKVSNGHAKVFVLENDTPIVGFLGDSGDRRRLVFYSDLNSIGMESGELGELSDVIDDLRPEDIIEICCFIDKDKAARASSAPEKS